jgi:hypothetical protein
VYVVEIDCWNHMRNLWLQRFVDGMSNHMKASLSDSLSQIDARLRVSTDLGSLIRMVDKASSGARPRTPYPRRFADLSDLSDLSDLPRDSIFSLPPQEFSRMGNYAKGHGANEFWPWLVRMHPKEFVLVEERAQGSRQDLCVEGAAPPCAAGRPNHPRPAACPQGALSRWPCGAVVNYVYYSEYLDKKMRVAGFSNLLEESIFISVTSSEMIASARNAAIVDIAFSKPFRWLTGKTAQLGARGFDWSVASMSRAAIILEGKLEELAARGALLLYDEWALHIFDDIVEAMTAHIEDFATLNERLELRADGLDMEAYLERLHGVGEKVRSPDGTVVFDKGKELCRRLFHPVAGGAVAATDELCAELAVAGAEEMLADMRDKHKATAKYAQRDSNLLRIPAQHADQEIASSHLAAAGTCAMLCCCRDLCYPMLLQLPMLCYAAAGTYATRCCCRYLLSTKGAMAWGSEASLRAHKAPASYSRLLFPPSRLFTPSLPALQATKGNSSTNDSSEGYFAGFTYVYNKGGTIAVSSASAVATSRRNDDYGGKADARGRGESRRGKHAGAAQTALGGGIWGELAIELQESLVKAARENLSAEIEQDRVDLAAQQECVRAKGELAHAQSLEKMTNLFIDRMYYFDMWQSDRCLKTVEAVTKALRGLSEPKKARTRHEPYPPPRSSRLSAAAHIPCASQVFELKEQIRIRVVGLGWSDLHVPWSKGGEAFGSAHLLTELKTIIAEQRTRQVPTKAPVPRMERKALPLLGSPTQDLKDLDQRVADDDEAFATAARVEKARREAAGVGDSFENRQAVRPPPITVGMRLEQLCWYDYKEPDADGDVGGAMWCACTVIATNDVQKGPRSVYKPGEAVQVRWDANDRVEPAEEESESAFELKPSRWNQNVKGAWRLDLDS